MPKKSKARKAKPKTSRPKPTKSKVAKPAAVSSSQSNVKRLYRSGQDKMLGGVCGGIGEYFHIDPVIIRILWILAALAYGSGILAYLIAWIIIPKNPKHRWD